MKKLLLIAIILACGNNQAHAMAQAQVQEGFILQTLRNCDQIISATCKVVAKTALLAGGLFLVYRMVQKIRSQKIATPVIVVDHDKALIETQLRSAKTFNQLKSAYRSLNIQYHPDNHGNTARSRELHAFVQSTYDDLKQNFPEQNR